MIHARECYAVIAVFYERYRTTSGIKGNGGMLPFGIPFRKR